MIDDLLLVRRELVCLRLVSVALSLSVLLLGLRLIVWMQESANWKAQVEERLRIAETWEVYWNQRIASETAKQEKN